eukprot:1487679-Prymnesium_polylepis.1
MWVPRFVGTWHLLACSPRYDAEERGQGPRPPAEVSPCARLGLRGNVLHANQGQTLSYLSYPDRAVIFSRRLTLHSFRGCEDNYKLKMS